MTKYLQKLGDSGDDDILGNFNGGWRNYTPNPEGGNGGEGEAQVVGKEKDCIMLEDEDSEEEVQFLGHASPLQPTTPKLTTSSSSSQLHQTPRPSSSQKRKLNPLGTTTTEPRPSPQHRQARSAQSLRRSQWTFGGERRSTFGEPQRRSTAGSEAAAVEEALSPFSTPTKVRGSMSKDTRSINRSEGYEVVVMPVGGGELGFGNGGVAAASTPKSKIGGRLSFGSEIVGAVKEQLTSTPKSKNGGNISNLGSEIIAGDKEQLTPTPKNKNVSNVSFGSEVVAAVKDQLTTTPKSKNIGLRFFGSEVVAAAKEQLTPTPKSKIGGLGLRSEAIAAAKDHTAKSKNAGVDHDWEVVELGSSTDLTIPHRPSIPRKPVIDLEDYEVLPPLTGTTSNTTIPHTIIDDSDSEAEFEFEIISSHTLNPLPRRRSTIYPLRNPPILHPLYSLTSTTISNLNLALSPSTVVELSDGDFLKITDLIRNVDTAEITLRGHRFQRTRDLNGLLAKKRNELCWVTEVDEDDDGPAALQSLAEVPASSVTRVRTALITNMSFPAATFRNTPHPGNLENVENEGLVTVRWKYTTTWPSAKERVNNENAFCERVLRHLEEGDKLVGEGLRIKDELAREQFRGPTVLGGSYVPVVRRGGNGGVKRGDSKLPVRLEESGWLRRLPGSRSGSVLQIGGLAQAVGQAQTAGRFDDDMVDLTDELPKTGMNPRPSVAEATQERMLSQIDLTTPELSLLPSDGTVRATNAASMKKTTIKRVEGQIYTYGDAFCGAGGATRGAHMAGLKVMWGFDFNSHACETWRLNFPSATMYEMSAFDVCDLWAKEAKGGKPNRAQVDILHISPPCQFFSPAHTIAGKDDEMNTASLLACGRLLALVKPRIVTLEQTFGIGHAEFTRWFNALIHQFTDNRYSLRWKICHLQDWGLPQRRHRLIIIATCPGETLPPFPPYTHSRHPTPGLKPYTSVNSILSSIRAGAPDHDLATALSKPLHENPWDGSSIAPRAITTHGGNNYHPSGARGLTNREFAALQGFPGSHRFGERNVKKQVGNAVPPSVAAVLFGQVRRWLEEKDGVEKVVVVVD